MLKGSRPCSLAIKGYWGIEVKKEIWMRRMCIVKFLLLDMEGCCNEEGYSTRKRRPTSAGLLSPANKARIQHWCFCALIKFGVRKTNITPPSFCNQNNTKSFSWRLSASFLPQTGSQLLCYPEVAIILYSTTSRKTFRIFPTRPRV